MRYTKERYLANLFLRNPGFEKRFDYSDTEYNNSSTKIRIRCRIHDTYFEILPGDHRSGLLGCKDCAKEQKKKTMLEKYGVDNYFKRTDLVKEAMQKKYGVTNPGLLPSHKEKVIRTCIRKYGVEAITQLDHIQEKTKRTNLKRYGCERPMQNSSISKKAVATKIRNGGFTKSNSSKAATEFILQYINEKGYELEQCAFALDDTMHEWGIYHERKWFLFDLTVFELGKRGNKNHIIEILEYHGPFHYTESDVATRGKDKAYPWKSNNTTIRESFERDKEKERLAKSLTSNFTIFWAHNKEGDV